MYKVELTNSRVAKELDSVPNPYFARLDVAILSLGSNPRPRGAKKLAQDKYRIRVGDYRILYWIDDKKKVVIIAKIKHRRESYR